MIIPKVDPFIEGIRKKLKQKIAKKHNCTHEIYSRHLMHILLNRFKCSFYVKYFEMLYIIEETDFFKEFYDRKQSIIKHLELKFIYNWLYRSKPNYYLIDCDSIISRNMKAKQALINKLEEEKITGMPIDKYAEYQSILPDLLRDEKRININKHSDLNDISHSSQDNDHFKYHNGNNVKNDLKDKSIDSIKDFVTQIFDIEYKILEVDNKKLLEKQSKKNIYSMQIIQTEDKKYKMDINSIKNSLKSRDSLRKSNRQRTINQRKFMYSLNRNNKPYYNPMFPTTESFFNHLSKKENNLKEMKSYFQDALTQSSNNKMRLILNKTRNGIKLPQVSTFSLKHKLNPQLQTTTQKQGNYLNLNTYSNMKLHKSNNLHHRLKLSDKKYSLLKQYYSNNINNSSNINKKDYKGKSITDYKHRTNKAVLKTGKRSIEDVLKLKISMVSLG